MYHLWMPNYNVQELKSCHLAIHMSTSVVMGGWLSHYRSVNEIKKSRSDSLGDSVLSAAGPLSRDHLLSEEEERRGPTVAAGFSFPLHTMNYPLKTE